jgi:hypothetical protein
MVVLEPYDIKVLMLGSREVIRTRGGALFYKDEEYLFFPKEHYSPALKSQATGVYTTRFPSSLVAGDYSVVGRYIFMIEEKENFYA